MTVATHPMSKLTKCLESIMAEAVNARAEIDVIDDSVLPPNQVKLLDELDAELMDLIDRYQRIRYQTTK